MNDAKPLEPDLNGFTANITATGNAKPECEMDKVIHELSNLRSPA